MLPSPNVHLKTRSSAVKNGNGSTSRHRRAPLSATEATLLAYALFHGRLSAQQACRLAGANGAYFAIVNVMNDHERDLLGRGEILLADLANAKRNGNGKSDDKPVPETLLEHIQRSTAYELAAAVKEYGVGRFFDAAIVPILDGTTDVNVITITPTEVTS